VQDLFFSASI